MKYSPITGNRVISRYFSTSFFWDDDDEIGWICSTRATFGYHYGKYNDRIKNIFVIILNNKPLYIYQYLLVFYIHMIDYIEGWIFLLIKKFFYPMNPS